MVSQQSLPPLPPTLSLTDRNRCVPQEAMRPVRDSAGRAQTPKSSWAQTSEKPREVKMCLRLYSETRAGPKPPKTCAFQK